MKWSEIYHKLDKKYRKLFRKLCQLYTKCWCSVSVDGNYLSTTNIKILDDVEKIDCRYCRETLIGSNMIVMTDIDVNIAVKIIKSHIDLKHTISYVSKGSVVA